MLIKGKRGPVPRTNFQVPPRRRGERAEWGRLLRAAYTDSRLLPVVLVYAPRPPPSLSHSHSIFFSFSLIRSRFLIRKN